jgi:hypothetical protein
MPDSLSPTLTEAERRKTADRLWKIKRMIAARRPHAELEEAVLLTVRDIEPIGAEYQETNHG